MWSLPARSSSSSWSISVKRLALASNSTASGGSDAGDPVNGNYEVLARIIREADGDQRWLSLPFERRIKATPKV
jgi:hypothetical protein